MNSKETSKQSKNNSSKLKKELNTGKDDTNSSRQTLKKSTRQKADTKQIAKLILDNRLTQEQTSQLTGISRSRISEIMSEVRENPELILFQENKDKIFEALQAKLVNLADDDVLKKMLEKRGCTDIAILNDKIQALRGQATSVTLHDIRVLIDSRPRSAEVEGKEAVPQIVDVTPE